jgi:hypothetical protein
MMELVTAASPSTVQKPDGGYRFITVVQLCMIWWTYRHKRLRLLDLRTWFAAHELVARRCGLKPGQHPAYTLDELHRLVGGVGGEHLRASIHRLEAEGMLTWSATAITFATTPGALQVEDCLSLQTMLEGIPNNRRRVPVPRRTVRFIAGGARRVMIATILGHLLRCIYFRRGQCVAEGLCKARWIATVFGVDLRNVKAARKHLADIGWLTLQETPQWVCNRWGQKVVINLVWSRPAPEELKHDRAPESPPPDAFSPTRLPPPDSHQEPLPGLNHQKPTSGRLAGTLTARKKDEKPTLHNVTPEDLRDIARLLILFEEATRQGVTKGSDSARLQFIAAAEHALVIGANNPCGLFIHLIRQKLSHFITQDDEDAANKRLKRHLYGQTPVQCSSEVTEPMEELEEEMALDAFG